ncbi:hypothetical protein [Sandaracinus amylolyticus]|uniref:Uncharacterized protein n=1 Tax=Sandaracinus amylolyticus TaxID=927083 RepID=A0A0F6W6D5_9BACT|nr:hypothetical protein [Sandaracinus amylolyticus]AKF08548.1 hypothetical protein DB32_005697 [Sandaracinus amylolyticus]
MSRRAEVARAIAIGGALIAIVVVAIAVVSYESARAGWSAERARLGSAEYDAARSDAAYVAVESARSTTRRSAEVAAALIVIAASLVGSAGEPRAGAPSRWLLASVIDVLVLGALLAIAITLPHAIESLALSDALARVAPAIALAVLIALLARGASPGMRAAGLAVAPPRPWRAILAILALPVVAPWIVIASVPLALRRDGRVAARAPHLALAGLLA